MKKILSAVLLAALLLTLATSALAATGLGVVGTMTNTAATAEQNGSASGYIFVCAVTLDDAGKIEGVVFDAMQPKTTFDATGAIVGDAVTNVVTKNELKEGYGMKGVSAIGKEWYEQAAGFCAYVTGKTIADVAGIAIVDGKIADADLAATTTIGIADFQTLIEKAGK